MPTTSLRTFDRFCDHSLPKSEWDHEAHLAVCWVALRTRSQRDAVEFLRGAIRSYNDATGVENTATSGYHDTLTIYFVRAVIAVGASTIDEIVVAPTCRREAPLEHWSRDLLFGAQARAHWVEPDLQPLPW